MKNVCATAHTLLATEVSVGLGYEIGALVYSDTGRRCPTIIDTAIIPIPIDITTPGFDSDVINPVNKKEVLPKIREASLAKNRIFRYCFSLIGTFSCRTGARQKITATETATVRIAVRSVRYLIVFSMIHARKLLSANISISLYVKIMMTIFNKANLHLQWIEIRKMCA